MKFAALLFAAAALLHADGGSVLLREQSGALLITVFGSPQLGPTDLSVLVQNASDGAPVLDAQVAVSLGADTQPATHAQAVDKLLYAATLEAARPGPCPLAVRVSRRGQSAFVSSTVAVLPRPAQWVAYWPYFALVPVAVLLFALNQYLKKQRGRRPPARP